VRKLSINSFLIEAGTRPILTDTATGGCLSGTEQLVRFMHVDTSLYEHGIGSESGWPTPDILIGRRMVSEAELGSGSN
jgi:hypothetical protein